MHFVNQLGTQSDNVIYELPFGLYKNHPTFLSNWEFWKLLSDYLINIFTGSLGWTRQHHGQTILSSMEYTQL